jgi:hypothetical protein
MGEKTEIFAGVGGFKGTGDEDEVREQVGRKNEGVLWTTGSWDALGKSSSKAKWESESTSGGERCWAVRVVLMISGVGGA